MPIFNDASFSKLSTCHIDLQRIFFEVIKTFNCTVLEGHRGQEAQDKAFADGKTQLKWPNGNHNATPSNAVDVAPCPLDWNNMKEFCFFAGFVKGVATCLKAEGKITHSIRWGGDWNGNNDLDDNKFNDLVHFELCVT